MGLLGGILGNASSVSKSEVNRELEHILIPNEEIDMAFKLIRDLLVFTDKRLILVDKQGITGKKTEYHTIPYQNISHFSVETLGTFDLDSELKIWVKGSQGYIEKRFTKDNHIKDIQRALAIYTLR